MKKLRIAIGLALLLLPVGPLVRPAAEAQQPTAAVVTLTVTLVQHVDVFQTASQTYTLTQTPSPSVRPQVFVNGLLMCAGNDFTLAGTALTFTGQQTAQMDTPTIQVWYWATN